MKTLVFEEQTSNRKVRKQGGVFKRHLDHELAPAAQKWVRLGACCWEWEGRRIKAQILGREVETNPLYRAMTGGRWGERGWT